MKIVQINASVNTGSTGRIAEEIGRLLIKNGHESYIAYGRGNRPSASKLIKIGNNWEQELHGLQTRLFDRHGFGSRLATEKFIKEVRRFNPDIIHLHNIHGYYLNIEVLFSYLRSVNKPVVWSLHDCWPFTGHCSYFDFVRCDKWKMQCYACPNKHGYPSSWLLDRSKNNYIRKKELFTGLRSLTFVSPSNWLARNIKESFLRDYSVQVVYHGVDIKVFKPSSSLIKKQYGLSKKRVVLGIANVWSRNKGLDDFIRLRNRLPTEEVIVLVGLNKKQLKNLPAGVVGITRTENAEVLADFYSAADVFVNPTYADNFPLTNIEALACGTPVITYNTGGSSEAVDEETGIISEKGDIDGLCESIQSILGKGKKYYSDSCRKRASELYNAEDRYGEYLELYSKMSVQ